MKFYLYRYHSFDRKFECLLPDLAIEVILVERPKSNAKATPTKRLKKNS